MAKKRFRDVKQKRINLEEKSQEALLFPYAPPSSKIKAFLTDNFMLLMPILYFVVYIIMGGREGFEENKLSGWLYIFIPLILVQTLFMLKNAQTPGYRAYNIKIIDLNTGEKPTFIRLLLRNIYAILSVLSFFGWIMMFFRKDSKTLHDLLSHTAIITYHD